MLLEKSVSPVTTATRGASWLCSLRNQLCLCVSVCVCVCVCAHPLSRAIDMQKRKWVHVSFCKKKKMLKKKEMFAGHLILTWCVCICYLCQAVFCQFYQQLQFSVLTHKHTGSEQKPLQCLHCGVRRLFTKKKAAHLWNNRM